MSSTITPPSTSEVTREALRHAVNDIVAPYGLGILMSVFLLGGVTAEARSYFKKFEDRIFLKLLVVFIWCTMLAHVIFGILSVQDMTLVHYGDHSNLIYYPKFINVNLIFAGIISVTTQSFFAYRLWKLSRSLIIPLLCWTLMIALVSLVLAMDVLSLIVSQSERTVLFFTQTHRSLIVSTLVLSVTVDVVITTSLISYLWLRRRGIFERTRRMVDRLILWTFQTGLLTSTFTVTMVATYLTMDNFVWLGIMYTKPGLFAVSLLASLNARQATSADCREAFDGSLLFPPSSSEGGVQEEINFNMTTSYLTVMPDPEKAILSKEGQI